MVRMMNIKILDHTIKRVNLRLKQINACNSVCLNRSYRIAKSIYTLASCSNWSAPNYIQCSSGVLTSPGRKGNLGRAGVAACPVTSHL